MVEMEEMEDMEDMEKMKEMESAKSGTDLPVHLTYNSVMRHQDEPQDRVISAPNRLAKLRW